jgi:uncharacterized membrane protein YciS (DUF1049 family)
MEGRNRERKEEKMETVLIISKVMLLVGLLICVLFVMKLKRSIAEIEEKAKTLQEKLKIFMEEFEVAEMESDARLFVKGLDDCY